MDGIWMGCMFYRSSIHIEIPVVVLVEFGHFTFSRIVQVTKRVQLVEIYGTSRTNKRVCDLVCNFQFHTPFYKKMCQLMFCLLVGMC